MKTSTRCLGLLCTAVMFVTVPAPAQLVTNGDFELPGFTPSPEYYRYLHTVHGTQNFLTGWNFAGTVQYEASFLMRAGGPYDSLIYAGSYGVNLNEGALMSTTFNVVAGQQYQFSIVAKTGSTLTPNALEVTAAGNFASFTPTATFTTYTFDFTAGTTGVATLLLELDSSGSAPLVVAIDNVSITAIPEPSTYALGAGLASLLALGVRRRLRPAHVAAA